MKMKLTADYQCWCLWDMDTPKNINPDTLPISKDLKKKLHDWEASFDKNLDRSNKENIGFKDDAQYLSFYNTGWNIFDLLKLELPSIEWWYRDQRYPDLLRAKPRD